MRKKRLCLCVLLIIGISKLSHAGRTKTNDFWVQTELTAVHKSIVNKAIFNGCHERESDEIYASYVPASVHPVIPVNGLINEEIRKIAIKKYIIAARLERESNAIHAHYVPDFVRHIIPINLLINIDFCPEDDLKKQTSNLTRLGLLIQRSDIKNLFIKKRAAAECYFQAALINIYRLKSTADNYNPEIAIDDLTSTGQLLFWAALRYDHHKNQPKLLQLSIDFFSTAAKLFNRIDKNKASIFSRKLRSELKKVHKYQKLRLSQN